MTRLLLELTLGLASGTCNPNPVVALRPMTESDLELVRSWLTEPHVARWYLAQSSLERELAELRSCVVGKEPTHALIALTRGREIGWCQWYRCADYPKHAAGIGAEPGDVGLDYAIGDPARIGEGLGTALIAAMIARIRAEHSQAGLVADPDAANAASRRVLEKNHFELVDVRVVPSERSDREMAIYRLRPPQTVGI